MIRALLSGIALMGVLFVGSAASAGAATVLPYPAPPVTNSTTQSVLPTSRSSTTTVPASTATSPITGATTTTGPATTGSRITTVAGAPVDQQSEGPLASTGAGFNVGLTVGMAVVVVLIGGALVILGTRLARSSRVRGH